MQESGSAKVESMIGSIGVGGPGEFSFQIPCRVDFNINDEHGLID
jgi:hypothetical protein